MARFSGQFMDVQAHHLSTLMVVRDFMGDLVTAPKKASMKKADPKKRR